MQYRVATAADIPALARIRSAEWETEDYWNERISGYMEGRRRPQHALASRIIYIAMEGEEVAGFIAGHLSSRFQCDGELEWINVVRAYRGRGIAADLVRVLAQWFVAQGAKRVCVDPDDDVRAFYARLGAIPLNRHWMVWENIADLLDHAGAVAT